MYVFYRQELRELYSMMVLTMPVVLKNSLPPVVCVDRLAEAKCELTLAKTAKVN